MARFYDQNSQPLTANFVFIPFGFTAKIISILNDDPTGTNIVELSWYGQALDGRVFPAQGMTWDTNAGNGIYLRYSGGAPAYRMMIKGD